MPPRGIHLAAPLVLPSLRIASMNMPVLPIHIPSLSLVVGGFHLTATSIILDEQGLSIGTTSLTLPGALRSLADSVTLINVRVNTSGHITAGQVIVEDLLRFHLFGARFQITGLRLSSNALIAQSARATLPPIFHVSSNLTVDHFAIHGDGHVDGSIADVQFQLGDIVACATRVRFTNTGILIDRAMARFPYLQGAVTLSTFSYDGAHVSSQKVSGSLTLSPITLGAVSIEATAAVMLVVEKNVIDYDFIGTGLVTLPNVGQLTAQIEIGAVDSTHPAHLYHAHVMVTLAHPLPIGSTPLRLRSISGDVVSEKMRPVTYTFGVTGKFATADGGFLLQGSLSGVFATDGNIGAHGDATLLHLVTGHIGLCVRFIARRDGVCAVSLNPHGAVATSTGAYFALHGETVFRAAKTGTLVVDAYGHLFADHGAQLSAVAQVNATVPDGFFTWGVPPCGFISHGTGSLGTFRHNKAIVTGIKATLNGHLSCGAYHPSFTRHVFINTSGRVDLSGDSRYNPIGGSTLPTAPPRGNAPGGGYGASRNVSTHSGTFKIASSQTDTVFTLLWRAGHPSLTLIDPIGRIFTATHPGSGNHAFQTNNPRALPRHFRHGVALYVPSPRPGTWHVQVRNVMQSTHFRFTTNGTVQPVMLLGAAGILPRARVAQPSRPVVLVRGTLTTHVENATVSLYYVPANGRMPGTLIATDVRVRNSTWQFHWDTRTTPSGLYSVYAIVNNGKGPAIMGQSTGMIRVRQSTRPDPPRDVDQVVQAHRFDLHWQPPSHAALVAGYYVHWREGSRGLWHRLNVGDALRYALNRVRTDVRYHIAVSAYDVRGHESTLMQAR